METTTQVSEPESDLERELEKQYVHTLHLMGLPPPEARRAFWQLLNEIKKESLETGATTLPKDFGDRLLERELVDDRVRALLEKKRAEGVNDHDIRWWWNMSHLERAFMAKLDQLNRQLLLRQFIEEQELSPEEATKKLRTYDPLFGEIDEGSTGSPDDQPLPYELKERVRRYVQRRAILDAAALTRDIEDSSSFNHLVRKELKRGNL
jgi:hypothetical protein